MSATRRDVGGVVRLANLLGVLGWHAVVGVACLWGGRRGFEALQPDAIRWAVAIMLAGSVIVIAELVFRRGGRALPVERLGLALGFAFAGTTLLGWGWVFWGSSGFAYDGLAAIFSRGVGASIDPETGAGFAGVPWIAVPFAAGLGGFAWLTATYAERHLPPRGGATSAVSLPNWVALVCAVLAMLAFGGVLHLSNGMLLGQ